MKLSSFLRNACGLVILYYCISSLFYHSISLSDLFIDEHWFQRFRETFLMLNFLSTLYLGVDVELRMGDMENRILERRLDGRESAILLKELKSIGFSCHLFTINKGTLAVVRVKNYFPVLLH